MQEGFDKAAAPVRKGVVHGHIHNYNNLTYIHGHIHKNEPHGGSVPNPEDILNCDQYEDCEHFEFINCHSLNLFGENDTQAGRQPLGAQAPQAPRAGKPAEHSASDQPRFVELDDKRASVPPSIANALDFLDCNLTCDDSPIIRDIEVQHESAKDASRARKHSLPDAEVAAKYVHSQAQTQDHYQDPKMSSNLAHILNPQEMQSQTAGPHSSSSSFDGERAQYTSSNRNLAATPATSSNISRSDSHMGSLLDKNDGERLNAGVDHLHSISAGAPFIKKEVLNESITDEMKGVLSPANTTVTTNVKEESPQGINPSAVNVMDIGLKHNSNHDMLGYKTQLRGDTNRAVKKRNTKTELETDDDDKEDTSVDDQLFENLCSQCVVNYDSMETPHFHHHSHSHLLNTPADMKVLKDLSSISNLYELLGKNGHSGCEGNDANSSLHPDHVSMNLLHSTLNGYNFNNGNDIGLQNQLQQASHGQLDHAQSHTHDHSHIHSCEHECDHDHDHDHDHSHDHVHDHTHISDQEYQQLPVHSQPMTSDFNTDLTSNTLNFNWSFNTNNEPIYCQWDDCLQPYDNLLDLQTHVLKDHVAMDDSKVLSCKWADCDFNTNDPCSMVNHVNGKHGVKFDVKVLDEKTKTKQAKAHKKVHETKEEPEKFMCKWGKCRKVFNSAKELNDHIENEHVPSGLSSYTCEWEGCNKTFVQKQKLLRHIKVHTKYKPFKCPICGKCFNTQDILTQHLRVHSGERPFKCHLCPKSYSTSSSLRIHIRTHTGEKPLSCPICEKRFNESSNLSKHIKTHKVEKKNSKKATKVAAQQV